MYLNSDTCHSLTPSTCQTEGSEFLVIGSYTSDELEWIWKEATVSHSRHYLAICMRSLSKITQKKTKYDRSTGRDLKSGTSRGGGEVFTHSTKTFCLYLQCKILGIKAINVFFNFLFHQHCRIIFMCACHNYWLTLWQGKKKTSKVQHY